MLKQAKDVNFIGNIEGRDIPTGKADVVICDGFVGNIVLKFAEGLAVTLFQLIKDAIKQGGIFAKLGAVLVMPALKKLGKRLDVSEYGGAPLLGVNGCCIICHGSSNAKAICSAIGVAIECVRNDVTGHIRDSIAEEELLAHSANCFICSSVSFCSFCSSSGTTTSSQSPSALRISLMSCALTFFSTISQVALFTV